MNLFQLGNFTLHSGEQSSWKVECDALTEADLETLARLIAEKVGPFYRVVGVPSGGSRLARALMPYVSKRTPGGGTPMPALLVDDVLTTGASMEQMRRDFEPIPVVGVVLFARREPPAWVRAVWRLWDQ